MVTGSGGYIGASLVSAMSDSYARVRPLVRRETPWLPGVPQVCDFCEPAPDPRVSELFDGAEVVVHLAGMNELKSSIDPERGLQASILATQRVADACQAAGVKRLIYVSTWLVYGASIQPGAILTESSIVSPRNAYAIARLASENVAASAAEDSFELVVLRLTNAVGPPADYRVDRWSLLTHDLCRQAITSGQIQLHTSGLQWRDFVPMSDVLDVIQLACKTDPSRPAFLPAGTYNLASGSPSTVVDFAIRVREALEAELDKEIPIHLPIHTEERTEAVIVSPSLLRKFAPRSESSLDDSINETVRFFLATKEHWLK